MLSSTLRRARLKTLLVQTDMRKAIASTMPLMVISERQRRMRMPFQAISKALLKGSTICLPIFCRPRAPPLTGFATGSLRT